MPRFLRKLANKAHFFRPEWLEDDDAPADAFGSFLTKDSTLSVWAIDEDESNLGRVIAALAASRDSLDKLDYVLFDDNILDIAGVDRRRVDGVSPDGGANQLWHQDLEGLSGKKLVALAANMRQCRMEGAPKGVVRDLIAKSIDGGFISRERMNKKLREKVELALGDTRRSVGS